MSVLDAAARAHLDPRRHADKPLGMRLEHDPLKVGALDLAKYVHDDVPVPATLARNTFQQGYAYGMLDNDQYGDCDPAADYHIQEIIHLRFGVEPQPWPPAIVLAWYFAVNGVPPGPAGSQSDQGTDPSVSMNYWQQKGLATTGGHKLAGWGWVAQTNPAVIRRCIYEFGAVKFAVELATEQQQQGADWVYVPGQQCGSWGGHAIAGDSYDTAGFGIVTWGELGTLDNAFQGTCGDGAWVPLTHDAIGKGGVGPGGMDFAQMAVDLAALSQGQPEQS